MRLLVLLLLCISSVVLVEGGRRRRRWIRRRRRRWNPVRAVKKVVRCPTSWWKVGGVNLLKYYDCAKFSIYWTNLANALARPWAGFGDFIWQVLQDAGKFFRDIGNAMKKFFELVGKKIMDGLKAGSDGFVRFCQQAYAQTKGTLMAVGRFTRKTCDGLKAFTKGGFAEVQGERSSSSNWWERNSPNICSDSSAPNSLPTLWDCGIDRALSRHQRGPGNINNVGRWLREVGNIFNVIARKLGQCVVPHKKACTVGKIMSVFPFVTVDRVNLCFFKAISKKVVPGGVDLGKKIERFFKPISDFFGMCIKGVAKLFKFSALSTSRSNAGAHPCHDNKTRTYRNYFGFEVYFDLMVVFVAGCNMALINPLTWISALLGPIASFMSLFSVDIFIFFVRFGVVAGAVCGHKFTYGWCCPMWVFAGEWNMGKSPFRDVIDHNEKLKFKLTFRLCFLPRWGCGWNTQDKQHNVRSHGNSTTQFGICHGPGFKFLVSELVGTEYPAWWKWPLDAVCVGVCIILGFNWSGSVATFFLALTTLSWIGHNTSAKESGAEPDFPINLMYDLWCGYIDICFSGDSACHRARHKNRGGRFR